MFRLLPKQQQLFERLERMAELGSACSATLSELLESPADAARLLPKSAELEQGADDLHHELQTSIGHGAAGSLDPTVLLELAGLLDDVVDAPDVAAHRLVLYKARGIRPHAATQARLLTQACRALAECIKALRTGRPRAEILTHVVEVNRVENEGDAAVREALAALFTTETDAIELIKWKELHEVIEEGLDVAERAANLIGRLTLEVESRSRR